MSAGATAPATRELVVDLVTYVRLLFDAGRFANWFLCRSHSLRSPNRTLRLPPEVWERVIGWIPYYSEPEWNRYSPLSRSTLVACTLVCRSWLHKSQYLLFPVVVLRTADKANSFLAALRTSPSLGRNVGTLDIGPVKQDSDRTPKTPCFYNWIYTLLNTLPPILPNVQVLIFQNLPTMHKSFFVLAPQFKSVTTLNLEGLVHQSFSEIIRLINHFSCLHGLVLDKCQWRQPAHCYSGIHHRLQKVEIETDSNCKMDGPKWLLASNSALALTQLWIHNCINSTYMVILNQILKQCTSTLIVLRLDFDNDTALNFPTLVTCTSLEYIEFWLSIETLNAFASQISVPITLSLFQLNIESFIETVFETQYQTIWQIIDISFSDSRLKSLSHFIIWTKSKHIEDFQKSRTRISEKILPKLFKKDILWWGDLDTHIAYHISSYDQRSLPWYQLAENYT